MLKTIRKIICACMATLILTSLLPVYAEGFGSGTRVYIIDNTLSAHQDASASSKVLGTMSFGESMTMLSFSNDWVKIRNSKGLVGYCKLTGLSNRDPNTLNETVYAKISPTPVYQKPGTLYKKVSVKQNTKLNVVAVTPDGKWMRVKNGTVYGFVQASDVSKEALNVHGALVAQKMYVNCDNTCTVTTGKGTGKVIGRVSHGQAFMVLETSGRYSRIRNSKGQTGWCLSEILTTKDPNIYNKTMYAQVGGSILYPNSILRGSAKKISKNAAVTVVAVSPNGGWCRVKYNGSYYYVCSIFLDTEKASESGRKVHVWDSSETLYAKASFSSKKVATVKNSDVLYLIGVSGTGAKVRTAGGKTGFLPIGTLKPID